MQHFWRAAAIVLLLACGSEAAWARRLALVIGNDAYQHIGALKNARNDADAMGKALQGAGFAVTRVSDLSREAMFKALDAFVLQVGKDDHVVFYYAGHGVQIDASPYLLPVDIRADSARQLTRDALPLDTLLTDLSRARYALVVIDACRDNPFADGGKRSIGAQRGLQPVEPPEGIAVILAAGRGQAALDSLGPADKEPNGLFTREFIRQMAVPGVPVRDMLLKVRDAVEQRAATVAHKQRPALIDESRGQFFFHERTAAAAAAPQATADATAVEIAYWNSVQERGSVDEIKLYLQRYPRGLFADLAQARIARLQSAAAAPAAANSAVAPGDSEARRRFELAQKGNAGAMANLGDYYRDARHGLPRDYAQAEAWYRKGAELGNLNAMSGLGTLYERGLGVPRDAARAVALYKQAADGAELRGMNNLGLAYANGTGGLPQDDAKALEWYRRAAAAGNAYSMAHVGFAYSAGRGVARDDAEAVRWYQKAVDAGGGYGMWRLADMLLAGRGGLARDPVKAEELYRRAVAAGEAPGMNGLGTLYLNGWGVPRNEATAAEWFRKAMEQGEARGISNVALMVQTGRGGYTKDLAKARELYEQAAEQGDTMALHNLGNLHADGAAGLAKNTPKAIELWTRAANRGFVRSMVRLGTLYQEGREVPQDLQAARGWYERAASFNDDAAKKALQALR